MIGIDAPEARSRYACCRGALRPVLTEQITLCRERLCPNTSLGVGLVFRRIRSRWDLSGSFGASIQSLFASKGRAPRWIFTAKSCSRISIRHRVVSWLTLPPGSHQIFVHLVTQQVSEVELGSAVHDLKGNLCPKPRGFKTTPMLRSWPERRHNVNVTVSDEMLLRDKTSLKSLTKNVTNAYIN